VRAGRAPVASGGMKRLLLVSAVLAAAASIAPAAHAQGGPCDENGCGPIARCHHWIDQATCLY
jgi:hypothetical protein